MLIVTAFAGISCLIAAWQFTQHFASAVYPSFIRIPRKSTGIIRIRPSNGIWGATLRRDFALAMAYTEKWQAFRLAVFPFYRQAQAHKPRRYARYGRSCKFFLGIFILEKHNPSNLLKHRLACLDPIPT